MCFAGGVELGGCFRGFTCGLMSVLVCVWVCCGSFCMGLYNLFMTVRLGACFSDVVGLLIGKFVVFR